MSQPIRRQAMQVFKIRGMTCAHCERAVIQAIQALDPVARVQVDLAEVEGWGGRRAGRAGDT